MIQCKDCELCEINADGQKTFHCDPFGNIKEPACIQKWQLIRLDMLTASYQKMMLWYEKMTPMQNKIYKFIQQQIDETNEADKWKLDDEDQDSPDFL
jgi:hypothetical protein